jgi:hypothetical protein
MTRGRDKRDKRRKRAKEILERSQKESMESTSSGSRSIFSASPVRTTGYQSIQRESLESPPESGGESRSSTSRSSTSQSSASRSSTSAGSAVSSRFDDEWYFMKHSAGSIMANRYKHVYPMGSRLSNRQFLASQQMLKLADPSRPNFYYQIQASAFTVKRVSVP